MIYDFDSVIDRKGTDSLKFDFTKQRGKPENIMPLWVADMDFRTAPCVIEALVEKSRHGIFGYSDSGQAYFDAVKGWMVDRFGWETRPEWLVKTPGVVYALCTAIRGLTEKGDAVLIQQPVYYPFFLSILNNERKLVNNALVNENGRYRIDFEDFEKKIVDNGVKLFILCNPHNPVGRVWTRDELVRMGDICMKHGVLVISDEIHQDFIFPGHKHLVFSALKPGYSDRTITCTAPSKTFNLAGLQISNIFIENPEIRRKFEQEMARSGYGEVSIMGLVACKAAYEKGKEWLDQLMEYLIGNTELVRSYVEKEMPGVRLIEPEGTYLLWLDFRALGMSGKELDEFIINRAGLWINTGEKFGIEGEGFQRINIACPRTYLEQALKKLAKAVRER